MVEFMLWCFMLIFTLSINLVLNVMSWKYLKFITPYDIYSGNFMVVFQTITPTATLPDYLKSYVEEGPAKVGIGVNCTCRYKRVQLKSDLQNSGIWSATARRPHCLCYHPAAFFHHLHLITFSFPLGKIWHTFQNVVNSFFNTHVCWYGVNLSRKWGSDCACTSKSASFLSKNLRALTKAPQESPITNLTLNTKRQIIKCFYITFE